MNRVESFQIQSNIRKAGLVIPEAMRGDKPNQIRRTGIPVGDTIGSTIEIEHFNNYNSSGTHNSSTNATQTALLPSNEIQKTQQTSTPIFVSNIPSIYDNMKSAFIDFVEGKIGINEITEMAERMYKDILAHNIQMGRTDGNDPVFNEKLLRNAHGEFIYRTVDTLWFAMHEKGFEYAKETFGFTCAFGDSFAYYDAKYYYASKELQAIGDAVFSRVAKEEGLTGFRAADLYNGEHKFAYCFNTHWNMRAGPGNAGIAKLNDVNLSPPKDFKMFYSPFRHSLEARDNGSVYYISASDPLKHNGLTGMSAYILVPKGAELWRSLPFWMQLTKIDPSFPSDNVRIAGAFDISEHIAPGADFDNSLKEFFNRHVFNINNGALTIWHNGVMTEYDVPFCLFDEISQFSGGQLVPPDSYAGFMNSFEFHIFMP
jgi:hypothetical protein